MKFKWHFLFGFVVSYVLVYFFNFSFSSGLVIFLASWLIDIDHYPWYVFEMKSWSPLGALRWHERTAPKWFALSRKEKNKFRWGVFVFHSLIFWIVLGGLAFLCPVFLWILIGVAIHMVADFADLIVKGEPLYIKIFPCYVMKRNKNKKRLKEL